MRHPYLFIIFLLLTSLGNGQPFRNDTSAVFFINVVNEKKQPVEGASIELTNATTNTLIKAAITDEKGSAVFTGISPGDLYFAISSAGYQAQKTSVYSF